MAEIRDGDAYSITIADDARPCIVFPAGLFDKTQCPKDAKALAAAPSRSHTPTIVTSVRPSSSPTCSMPSWLR